MAVIVERRQGGKIVSSKTIRPNLSKGFISTPVESPQLAAVENEREPLRRQIYETRASYSGRGHRGKRYK